MISENLPISIVLRRPPMRVAQNIIAPFMQRPDWDSRLCVVVRQVIVSHVKHLSIGSGPFTID
jgi:hypothetical protein